MQYLNMLPYQIRKAIERNDPAALPLGVVEYHAEHLPLGVDCFTCINALERIEKRRPELVVLPPFYYGSASLAVAAPEGNGTVHVDSLHLIPVAEDIFPRAPAGRVPQHPCIHCASDGGIRAGNAHRPCIPHSGEASHFRVAGKGERRGLVGNGAVQLLLFRRQQSVRMDSGSSDPHCA